MKQAPLILLLALALGNGCSDEPECTIIDARTKEFTELEEGVAAVSESLGLSSPNYPTEWLANVRVCRFGEYEVWTPAQGDVSTLWILHQDGSAIIKNPGQLSVFERERRLVATLGDRDGDNRYDGIDYSPRSDNDPPRSNVWDRDLDGCADFKTVFQPGEPSKNFVKLGGRWLELQRQGDAYGYMYNDKFHEMGDAKGRVIEDALQECLASIGATSN